MPNIRPSWREWMRNVWSGGMKRKFQRRALAAAVAMVGASERREARATTRAR